MCLPDVLALALRLLAPEAFVALAELLVDALFAVPFPAVDFPLVTFPPEVFLAVPADFFAVAEERCWAPDEPRFAAAPARWPLDAVFRPPRAER